MFLTWFSEIASKAGPSCSQKTSVSLQVLVFLGLLPRPHSLPSSFSSKNDREVNCYSTMVVQWFAHMLLVTQAKTGSVWEHAIQSHEHHVVRILGLGRLSTSSPLSWYSSGG